MRYYVKKTGEGSHSEMSFEELQEGFKTGKINPDWGARREDDGDYDWVTVQQLCSVAHDLPSAKYFVEIPPSSGEKMSVNQLLFSFDGRIGRQTFLWAWIGLSCASTIGFAGAALAGADMVALAWLCGCLWMIVAVHVKRWHDRGKPGWKALTLFIPIVGVVWAIVELGFLQGTRGPNKYGQDPTLPQDDGTREAGYELLDKALRLERGGRIKDALAAYDDIARRYVQTTAGHDAEKSAESLRAKIG
jgi:uncharacterized membrane protein YhaH (DUF805 family)